MNPNLFNKNNFRNKKQKIKNSLSSLREQRALISIICKNALLSYVFSNILYLFSNIILLIYYFCIFIKNHKMVNSFHKLIEEAINEIKNGKVVIVADDERRENEGDFIVAAELVTPEIVNFMTIEGRGLICAALTYKRCKDLGLELMVENNNSTNRTNFTVSVDLIGSGCATGISAKDRAKTLRTLADENTGPEEFGRLGIFSRLSPMKEGLIIDQGTQKLLLN